MAIPAVFFEFQEMAIMQDFVPFDPDPVPWGHPVEVGRVASWAYVHII